MKNEKAMIELQNERIICVNKENQRKQNSEKGPIRYSSYNWKYFRIIPKKRGLHEIGLVKWKATKENTNVIRYIGQKYITQNTPLLM